ncbi:hypothetical protein CLV47_13314 [Antricoccus suffuscus]|uniref:VOC domain-containing protein n=1 Tax=Antricoccus suffuscus TaxID=1629062 RepID=A0A2T0YZH6_9ACTN|nr:VOC family protein [Antricoccus suffuscus]PRZ29505.1 hypothetical protein CLV47_13314 [Antricoccus suffuscus]
MPARDASTSPVGAPCWIDLFSSDPDRAQDFYGTLFGWTGQSAGEDYGGYVNFTKDGKQIAGMMKNDGSGGQPDGWTIYLSTPDAESTAQAAASAGGQIVVPVMVVPDQGSMAVVVDAGGAAVGIWQPTGHPGTETLGEPGVPCWFELLTRDYAASVAFYEQAFGWTVDVMSDTDDFRYSTLTKGDMQYAGVMDAASYLPEGVPAHWTVYLGTADVDATLAQVTKLGGTVLQPAEDSPYGRVAQAADPTGAVFKLVSA